VRTRWIIATILIIVGAVWVGQGLGLIRGSSFMTDDIRWAIIGVGMLVTGFAIGWVAFRSRGAA
jgi:hypothetical protein